MYDRKGFVLICLMMVLSLFLTARAMSWPWADRVLVTINGQNYSADDFRHWWSNWKDKDSRLPQSPRPFVDWFLLVQEANRMELYTDPDYRHKVMTFLKSRALMMLKGEEVDSKVRITEDRLRAVYHHDYSPRRLLGIFYFRDKGEAERMCRKWTGKSYHDTAQDRQKGISSERRWLRPIALPATWKAALKGLEPGHVTDPFKWEKTYMCLSLIEEKGPEDVDYRRVKGDIRQRLRKREETRLTAELVTRLREKYHVKVNKDLLDAIDPLHVPEGMMGRPLIITDKGNVSVGFFVRQVNREIKANRGLASSKKGIERIKTGLLEDMISQTLISWESLDRHYERRPPFKWVYRYYCQHRLIRSLEDRLFKPKIEVSSKDVKRYYLGHLQDFTRPGTVSLALVKADSKQIAGLWKEVSLGADLLKVARARSLDYVPVHNVPVNRLPLAIRKEIEQLSQGETSHPFKMDGEMAVLKLLRRSPARPFPLVTVREKIRRRLVDERLSALKADYLKRLRERSKIKVNHRIWRKLQSELTA